MHIDTAPWTGWLRIAIPLLQSLIFLATLTVIALGAASSATIERQWDLEYLESIDRGDLPDTSYTSTHELKVRIQLVCFYMLAPMAMTAFVVGEAWCFLTNELAPVYVIVASIFSMFVWAMELGFWAVCHTNSGDAVPNMCPVVFKNGKDVLFTISGLSPARVAVYIAAVLIALYLIYMILGASICHRERMRDKQRKRNWTGDSKRTSMQRDESVKESKLEAAQENTPMIESRASMIQARGDRPRKSVTFE